MISCDGDDAMPDQGIADDDARTWTAKRSRTSPLFDSAGASGGASGGRAALGEQSADSAGASGGASGGRAALGEQSADAADDEDACILARSNQDAAKVLAEERKAHEAQEEAARQKLLAEEKEASDEFALLERNNPMSIDPKYLTLKGMDIANMRCGFCLCVLEDVATYCVDKTHYGCIKCIEAHLKVVSYENSLDPSFPAMPKTPSCHICRRVATAATLEKSPIIQMFVNECQMECPGAVKNINERATRKDPAAMSAEQLRQWLRVNQIPFEYRAGKYMNKDLLVGAARDLRKREDSQDDVDKCYWSGSVGAYREHYSVCISKVFVCDFATCGQSFSRIKYPTHRVACGKEPLSCHDCTGVTSRKLFDQHKNVCAWRVIPCGNFECNFQGSAATMHIHRARCVTQSVYCPHLRCDFSCFPQHMVNHISRAHRGDLDEIIDNFDNIVQLTNIVSGYMNEEEVWDAITASNPLAPEPRARTHTFNMGVPHGWEPGVVYSCPFNYGTVSARCILTNARSATTSHFLGFNTDGNAKVIVSGELIGKDNQLIHSFNMDDLAGVVDEFNFLDLGVMGREFRGWFFTPTEEEIRQTVRARLPFWLLVEAPIVWRFARVISTSLHCLHI